MAANLVEVQRLYDIATVLDNESEKLSVDPAKYEAMYDEILQGSKGAQQTKNLAAQFIPKYLKHFPKFTDKSINCLIDLCEEEDAPTRVNAIKAFPIIAKISPESLPRLADILGQLLQAELQVELDKVKQALVSLLQQDLKTTLAALFHQSQSEDEDLRVKAISFIFEKVLPMRDEINKNEDIQKAVAENVKKVLPRVESAKEFQLFTDLISNLKIYSKGPAASEVLELLADINADFVATEDSHVAKLSTCLQSATEFLKKGATSAKFTECLSLKVLPAFEQMTEQHQVELMQQLTETCAHMLASDAKVILPPIYTLLLSQIPTPTAGAEEPKLNFSITESALYVFHLLAAKAPGSLRAVCGINVVTGQPSAMSTELAVDKRQDFDARLKYLVERTKKYIQQMETAKKNIQKDDVQKKNMIEVALKATQNVLQLAQNLAQRQPNFSGPISKISLSFKLNKRQQQPQQQQQPQTKSIPNTTKSTLPKREEKAGAGARPAFGEVYVPPKRQQATQSKKRGPAETVEEQPQADSQKKHKGRGTSKFQSL